MRVGIFLSENISSYDTFRQEPDFLNRLAKSMLKRALPGMLTGLRGNVVAADSILRALIREGSASLDFYVHARQKERLTAQIKTIGPRSHQASMHSIEDVLLGNSGSLSSDIWFNPMPTTRSISGREGVEVGHVLRRTTPRHTPITLLTHGVSYSHLLYDFYLRVMLEGTFEFDSLICSSRASKHAVQTIIGHVEEEFRAATGAKLEYKGRTDLIPLCVDVEGYLGIDRTRARGKLKIPLKVFVILVLGHISPLKADLYPFLDLLRSLVTSQARDFVCVIAGTEEPGYVRQLQEKASSLGIAKQLRFMLDVSDQTKQALLGSADVFVSPTDCVTESFGLTVLEAMASGVPQVVPDWDGYRDTVRNGETGFLIPTQWMACTDDLDRYGPCCGWQYDHFALGQSVCIDMQLMEERIRLLMENEPLRQELAEASRRVALSDFGFKTAARNYEALWQELQAIAQHSANVAADQIFASPRYHHCFGHYASQTLTEASRVVITKAGFSQLQHGCIGVPAFAPSLTECGFLDEELLRDILSLFEPGPASQRSASSIAISFIVENLGPRKGTAAHLKRHVLWLLKYGYLKCPPQGTIVDEQAMVCPTLKDIQTKRSRG